MSTHEKSFARSIIIIGVLKTTNEKSGPVVLKNILFLAHWPLEVDQSGFEPEVSALRRQRHLQLRRLYNQRSTGLDHWPNELKKGERVFKGVYR